MQTPTLFARPKARVVAAALIASLAAGCASHPQMVTRDQPGPCSASADQVVTLATLKLAYRQYGPRNGAPVILEAGTGQKLVDWPPALINALTAKGYRVTVFDNRDMGCSTHLTNAGPPDFGKILTAMGSGKTPPVAYTLDDLAADTAGLMDALHIPKANIVGVSQGAIVAEMFAADYPERTLSLTAIAPNSGNKAIPVPANPKRFAGLPPAPPAGAPQADIVAYKIANSKALQSVTHPRSDEELRAIAAVNIARSYDPDASGRQSAAALVTPDLRQKLKGITAPTVVIQGAEDPLIPRAMAEDVAQSVPGARLVVIDGMGHDLPDAVAPEIVSAIASVARH
ncbi:MAG: alpha/beta fold hydrolase [Alphaproteobacteria bacterium]|nr:alpha/beta fold hydrolase [Alphaproteobacteria bacterium]